MARKKRTMKTEATPLLAEYNDLDNWQKLDYHEFCTLFPTMTDDEYQELVSSMKQNGYFETDPVVLCETEVKLENGTGIEVRVLDGRNRHQAAMDAGVTPLFKLYDGDDPLGFVTARNLQRRHLTTGQKAAIASKIANLTVGDNQESDGVSRKEAANKVDTSEVAIKRFRQVQEADPALAAAVEGGSMTLNAAYEQVKGQADAAKSKPQETEKPEPRKETIPPSLTPDPNEKKGSTNMEFEQDEPKAMYDVWYVPETGQIMLALGKVNASLRRDTATDIHERLGLVLEELPSEQ